VHMHMHIYIYIYRARASYPVVMDLAIKLGSIYGQGQKIAAMTAADV